LQRYRDRQMAAASDSSLLGAIADPTISDADLRASLEKAQLRLQRERGIDLTIFSPRASAMGHHIGSEETSIAWSRVCNDLIARVCSLYPKNFVGVCQLPQSPGADLSACLRELNRCINELGFVGCNLNPDPSGGHWTSPPLTDRFWYPLYERMTELAVPAMVHVSASCNPNFHATGAHYINADTTAFMQFLQSDLFRDFPTLRFIIPHGGGAVPYHWGRYRGLAQDMNRPPLEEALLENVFFDTCVYHLPGIELLTRVIPIDNILFGSEMLGAVRGVDPRTGYNYDDTKRSIDALPLSQAERRKVFEGNARRVYPRLDALLSASGSAMEADPDERDFEDVPGTVLFDAQRSRQGYALNMFCHSLMKPENRAAFKAGERAYLASWKLTPEQERAVLERDWNAMLALGGNVFYTAKLGATDGLSFQQLAAHMSNTPHQAYADMMLAGGRSLEGNRSKKELERG